jgi:hypothetical protein
VRARGFKSSGAMMRIPGRLVRAIQASMDLPLEN